MKAVKFLLLALIACTVCLTSCKKPDPKEDPVDPKETPAGTFKATFGEQEWTVKTSDCGIVDNSGDQCLFVNVSPNDFSELPMLYFMLKAETGRHMASTDPHLFMMYYKASAFNLNFNGQPLNNLGDYWAGNGPIPMGNVTIEISALDVSTLKVSMKGQGTCWEAPTYIRAYNEGREEIVPLDFNFEAKEVTLTRRATKSMSPVAQIAMQAVETLELTK